MSVFSGLRVVSKPIGKGEKPVISRVARGSKIETKPNTITIIEPNWLGRKFGFLLKGQDITVSGRGDVLVRAKGVDINSYTGGTLKTKGAGSLFTLGAYRVSTKDTSGNVIHRNVARNSYNDGVGGSVDNNTVGGYVKISDVELSVFNENVKGPVTNTDIVGNAHNTNTGAVLNEHVFSATNTTIHGPVKNRYVQDDVHNKFVEGDAENAVVLGDAIGEGVKGKIRNYMVVGKEINIP